MFTRLTENTFREAFFSSDTYKDSFTHDALTALFAYYEDLEDAIGEPIEFDLVSICCEWAEYKTADEAASNYFQYEGMEYDEEGNETITAEEVEEKAIEFLNENTQVVTFTSGILIISF